MIFKSYSAVLKGLCMYIRGATTKSIKIDDQISY